MNCEICNKKGHHRHHIISKAFGGGNGAENIAFLCASCHCEVHNGCLIIEGRFFSPDNGNILVWRTKEESPITGLADDRVYIVKG